MPATRSLYHLDAEDYVHVLQTTGAPIQGRFDGVDHVFEDGVMSDPIHWRVAHHIFGFRGNGQARLNALHRLGWLNRMDMATAEGQLRMCVSYQPLELLPKGVLEFRQKPATNEPEAVMPTANASAPVEPETPETASPASSADNPPTPRRAPHDPLRRAKQG